MAQQPSKPLAIHLYMWKKALTVYLVFLLCCLAVAGQKLAFQNLSTANGLIQAQVFCITQDQQRHIWLGTVGGIDRFDGSVFRHFSKSEGLNSTIISDLYAAPNGYIWAATQKGISCYNGHKMTNYPYAITSGAFLSSDKKGNIWALHSGKALAKFVDNKFVLAPNPFADAKPIFISKDADGDLLVNFHPKGFYKLKEDRWQKMEEIPADTSKKYKKLIQANQAWYAMADSSIAMYRDGKRIASVGMSDGKSQCISADKNGNIWVGTPKGVRVFSGQDLSVIAKYMAASGFSDNNVNDLFCDVEGNLWLATDGDGVFKFSDGVFGRYDKSNGLPGKIVMGLARKQNDNLYIATREGGLVEFDMASKKITPINVSPLKGDGINCITLNKAGELLLGKVNTGAMLYNGRQWQPIRLKQKGNDPGVNAIYCDGDRTWFATNDGCYCQQNGTITKVDSINTFTLSVLPQANNETLIGTVDGLYSFTGNGPAKKVMTPLLQNIWVLCMISHGPYTVIGTLEDGLLFWDRRSDKVSRCYTVNGLSDNRVFALLVDSKKNLWVVGGTSVQQVNKLDNKDSFAIRHFSAADGYENSEGNLNAIVEDKLGRIWIGNTNGASVFTDGPPAKESRGPFVVIQDVDVPGSALQTSELGPWYQLPQNLNLPYSKNSISFVVKGIYQKHPESVQYSCQLVGYDREFSSFDNQTFFNYQNLNPGRYVFRVKALTKSGLPSENIAEFAFTVVTPFYKATWFYVLLGLLLLLTGGWVQFLLMRAGLRKRKQRALIRKEEQQAIRLRTSEDFHDELGNKLTRISLLTDILQKKTGPEDLEKNKLIAQIKENVLALYAGTRDIIWSLSSGSDSLKETLNRIGQFGEDLFLGTDIHFEMQVVDPIDAATVLPMDYSRNILMVFKESLNNSLKHAQCTQVTITVQKTENGGILITQSDNGKGYDGALSPKGNGLNNIRRRAQRIHAEITVTTAINKGVSIALLLKIPPKG
jgi:signal transduction histidine kinase/ligand-binding sensor domain-containing protein